MQCVFCICVLCMMLFVFCMIQCVFCVLLCVFSMCVLKLLKTFSIYNKAFFIVFSFMGLTSSVYLLFECCAIYCDVSVPALKGWSLAFINPAWIRFHSVYLSLSLDMMMCLRMNSSTAHSPNDFSSAHNYKRSRYSNMLFYRGSWKSLHISEISTF